MEVTAFYHKSITYRAIKAFKKQVAHWLGVIGFIGYMLLFVLKEIFSFNLKKNTIIEQAARFGVDSLPITLSIVGMTAAIISLQVATEMVKQGAGSYVGALVTVVMVREIGPIMAGFAVISMVGSSMAAEIGTMQVTEQIDAMKVLKVDPIRYLIAPRVLAGFIIMPFVVIFASLIGIIGGGISANITSDISALNYVSSVKSGLWEKDLWVCILKSAIFGGIIAHISSTIGYMTKGGAKDVGESTTRAVVWSFIAIVIIDYIIALMFFS